MKILTLLMKEKLLAYTQLMRLDKPIGTLLLLWPTMWALIIAGQGSPQLWNVLVFLLGTFLMRSAGCAINDFADRHLDAHVTRTRNRPLPLGKVTSKEAIILSACLSSVALLLVLTMNLMTILLSIVAVLLTIIYPFMKRYIKIPQLILAIAFSWGIPMVFAAECNNIPIIAWWLLLANMIWTIAYDTIYAMVDRQDDLAIGIKSSAILFDRFDKKIIVLLQAIFVFILIHIGQLITATVSYYWLLVLIVGYFSYQQWLIYAREPEACFKAFLNNNYVGITVLMGFYLVY